MQYAHFEPDTIASWDRFYRANLLNCLSGFKSTHLIGTLSQDGYTNLGLFHNVVHIGSDPALIGYINRPREAAPHTLENIERTGVYTMNSVQADMIQRAHQTSAKYPRHVSEFEAAGVSACFRKGIPAPFVLESAIQYALRLVEVTPIRHNNTFLVIGRLIGAWVREDLIGEDGYLSLEKAETVTSLGLDGYYGVRLLERYPYAKPDPEHEGAP
ncbi:MAG: flavin reductase [Saprospiraceae bacterium]|nr:flavin reductase [Saprospiraceae bacterium]